MKKVDTRIVISAVIIVMLAWSHAYPRDLEGKYKNSPLHDWFDQLRSAKGLCCSDADGTALSDIDWQSDSEGHFKVRIDGKWIDVPEDAVITEPNKAGRTMVWPIRDGVGSIYIRCFILGTLS